MQYRKSAVSTGNTKLRVNSVINTVNPIRLTVNQKNIKHPVVNGGRVLLCALPTLRAEPCHQDVLFGGVIAPRSHRSPIWRWRSFDSSERFDFVSSCWNKVDKKICRVEPRVWPEMLVGVDTRSPEEGDWGAGSSHGGNLTGSLDLLKNT